MKKSVQIVMLVLFLAVIGAYQFLPRDNEWFLYISYAVHLLTIPLGTLIMMLLPGQYKRANVIGLICGVAICCLLLSTNAILVRIFRFAVMVAGGAIWLYFFPPKAK